MAPRRKTRHSSPTSPSSPPLPRPSTQEDPWTDDHETALLKAIIAHKPTGPHKHMHMLAIQSHLSSHGYATLGEAHTRIPGLWRKLGALYDLPALDERELQEWELEEREFELLDPESEDGFAVRKWAARFEGGVRGSDDEGEGQVPGVEGEQPVGKKTSLPSATLGSGVVSAAASDDADGNDQADDDPTDDSSDEAESESELEEEPDGANEEAEEEDGQDEKLQPPATKRTTTRARNTPSTTSKVEARSTRSARTRAPDPKVGTAASGTRSRARKR